MACHSAVKTFGCRLSTTDVDGPKIVSEVLDRQFFPLELDRSPATPAQGCP